MFPGPTIKATRGRKTVVSQINRLHVPTVTHLHGGKTPSNSDGFPTDLIVPADFPTDTAICSTAPSIAELARQGKAPQNSTTHEYPNEQTAATLWYHDHAMDHTGRNVYMGLAGFYLIGDDEEAAFPLPKGQYDVPLMLCVRQFDGTGAIVYDDRGHLGAQGDVVLVNGAPWPRMEVERRRYRFRILNAANATPFTLAVSSGRPLLQIATDGGLLPAPVASQTLPLAMAERVEILIDFAEYPAGTKLVLQNLDELGPTREIMRFDVSEPVVEREVSIPERLANFEPLKPEQALRTREFRFVNDLELTLNLPPVSWDINGQKFDPNRVDAAPGLGDTEIWRFVHPHSIAPGRHVHPVHIHLVRFQVLERNGGPPPAHERGWKDTVRLEAGDDVRVIARFEGYRGRYVLHCHNLGHEDHSMMARFDVV
jgi:spore coat protein A